METDTYEKYWQLYQQAMAEAGVKWRHSRWTWKKFVRSEEMRGAREVFKRFVCKMEEAIHADRRTD